MAAESVRLGMNLGSHLLRNSFKGYKYCCVHRSLRVCFLTSSRHVQINCSYSLLCFIVMHEDIMERFILFLLDSTVNLFGGIVLVTLQEMVGSRQNALTCSD